MKNLWKTFFALVIVGGLLVKVGDVNSAVIFSWDVENGAVGELNNGSGSPFNDINQYDGIVVEVVDNLAHSGQKSVRLTYPVNEAGVELQVNNITPTPTLFTRKFEYFAPGWEKNWPVGLKTSRYFTGPDSSYAYHSEKMIWQTYDSTCDELYGMGMNSAIGDLDLEHMYTSTEIFGNGLPYIRTGHWYKIETWMVLNSGDGVGDGILKIWIDDVLVYDNVAVKWVDSDRSRPNGLGGWVRMWFGGNYSGAICGAPDAPLYRYIDDFYVSTTLDRDDSTVTVSTQPPKLEDFRLDQ